MADRPPENIWKRLTRLFRSGPVVRHKIARAERSNEPQGTASAFKRELSSLYVRALSSYSNYERLSRYSDYNEMEQCVSPDTLIAVPGGFKRIDDLAAEYGPDRPFIVYAYDHSSGKIVPALGKQARKTRTDHAWKVTFDNGQSIIATADHRLMLRDGSYRMVRELEPGMAMMPFKRRSILTEDKNDPDGYQFIYLGTTEGGRWAGEHRMVAEFMLGRSILEGEEVHHLNFRRGDNRPENLRVMDRAEHRAFHARLNNEKKWDRTTNADWIEEFSRRQSQFMRENNPATRHDVTFEKILSFADQLGYNCDRICEALGTGHQVICRRLQERGFRDWTAFATAYCPGWKNPSHDNSGTRNPRYDHDLTAEKIFAAHVPGITPRELCEKLGKPRTRVAPRLRDAGFKNISDFCSNYQNCRVQSVEYHGIIDLYDLTVDGYKNFATDSVVSHNTPELHSTLDIYSDETTCRSEDGHVVLIHSKNQEIKEILEELFFDVLDIDFNSWNWVRHLCKYGDLILFVDAHEGNGILNLFPIPINEVEREEGYDPEDPLAVRFRWLTRGNAILQNWQVIHFRLLGNDSYLPYGCSILEAARRIWRQLILIEDAMLVYRIVRSPERRVFHIEIGTTPPEQVDSFIEQVRSNLKRSTIIDQTTGQVDLRYNPLSVEDDYFLPKRGETMSRIDTLAGGQFPVRRDTKVPLLDGRVLAIEDLAREFDAGKENWVHSVQEGTNSFVPGKIVWCGRNYTCDRIHRVWLDDGSYIDMAPEHPIVMRDGTKKRADQVVPGESVMPFRTRRELLGKHDYRQVQDPADDEWKFIHKTVVRPRNKSAIHHVDFDRFNNRPDNLQLIGWLEHIRLHGENARRNLHTPEMDAENARRMIAFNRSERGRALTMERNSRRWDDPKFREEHSGTDHWLAKKWAKIWKTHSLMELADFCRSRSISSFKALLDRKDGLFSNANHYRLFLQHHGVGSWTEFARDHLGIAPRNHSVVRVEVLEGISDDVYCMTVVGPDGEEDRHNFAALGNRIDGSVPSDWDGIFVSNTGDIDDVRYIQSKLFAAIKIPRAYLGYEEGIGSKSTLSQEDVRFAKTIERIQRLFCAELNKIAIIHLAIMGFSGEDLANFEIEMSSPSTIAQQQRLELWRMKFEVAGMAQEGILDRGTIRRRILAMNDRDIARVKDGLRVDKLEDQLLGAIEAPATPGGEAAGEGGAPAPGATELPQTLGGQEGGEANGPPVQQAGFVAGPADALVTDARNPGSEGDDAAIAVDKGRDLFSTGESGLKLSFGTEKQTASDPYDRRAQRRVITRPFGEDAEPEPDPMEKAFEETERLAEDIERLRRWLAGRRR